MGNTLNAAFVPDFISPPGETLEDVLEERGMTQAELAERMGRAPKTVNEIIKGKAPITPEAALQLERVLDIPAQFWNVREQQYREALARAEEQRHLTSCLEWLENFPLNAMAKLGWIEKPKDKVDQLRAVLNYFGVASPKEWNAIWMNPEARAAFRKSLSFASDPGPIAAWLRYGEIVARERAHKPFDKNGFRKALEQIRSLTLEPPRVFEPAMYRLCAEVGVAVVLTPQLPKARICGATRWLTPDMAILQLSLRYKTDDHFWFTFFHEAGHILLHGKREVFLEDSDEQQVQQKEEEANDFASSFLIPIDQLQAFITRWNRSRAEVQEFARTLGIAPGIVVGQLQHKGFLPYTHLNDLKRRFEWSHE